jgi:hypothetical protein
MYDMKNSSTLENEIYISSSIQKVTFLEKLFSRFHYSESFKILIFYYFWFCSIQIHQFKEKILNFLFLLLQIYEKTVKFRIKKEVI